MQVDLLLYTLIFWILNYLGFFFPEWCLRPLLFLSIKLQVSVFSLKSHQNSRLWSRRQWLFIEKFCLDRYFSFKGSWTVLFRKIVGISQQSSWYWGEKSTWGRWQVQGISGTQTKIWYLVWIPNSLCRVVTN